MTIQTECVNCGNINESIVDIEWAKSGSILVTCTKCKSLYVVKVQVITEKHEIDKDDFIDDHQSYTNLDVFTNVKIASKDCLLYNKKGIIVDKDRCYYRIKFNNGDIIWIPHDWVVACNDDADSLNDEQSTINISDNSSADENIKIHSNKMINTGEKSDAIKIVDAAKTIDVSKTVDAPKTVDASKTVDTVKIIDSVNKINDGIKTTDVINKTNDTFDGKKYQHTLMVVVLSILMIIGVIDIIKFIINGIINCAAYILK